MSLKEVGRMTSQMIRILILNARMPFSPHREKPVPYDYVDDNEERRLQALDEFERCFTPHDLPLTALEFAKIVRRVMDEAPELTRAVLALQAERHKLGEMGVIEAITRGEPIGSSLMRIFDTSIPGADECDGRNALGCRDLFCEKYFEAPGRGRDARRTTGRRGYLTRSIGLYIYVDVYAVFLTLLSLRRASAPRRSSSTWRARLRGAAGKRRPVRRQRERAAGLSRNRARGGR